MNNQPHVTRPNTSAGIANNEREHDGGEAEVTLVADVRQARCLRNKLILANVGAWVIILILLKVFILG